MDYMVDYLAVIGIVAGITVLFNAIFDDKE